MFGSVEEIVIGHRLGVSYLQSSKEYVTLSVDSQSIQLYQTSMGIMAISGVVWDAGFFLADFLMANKEFASGTVLDVGCGTGVCGITSLLLGALAVTFTDILEPPSLDDNLGQLPDEMKLRSTFVGSDWTTKCLPSTLIHPPTSVPAPHHVTSSTEGSGLLSEPYMPSWDNIFCSDLLYDQKAHLPLLQFLRQIHFKKAIFAYKRRHDVPEREFFRLLSQHCTLDVVKQDSFELKNTSQSAVSGLFIIIATPM